jgi:hypothetical protein
VPTYFWSFDKGLTDVVGGVQMTFQTPAPNLIKTTFGKKQMALNYTRGYSTIPAGVYFETEFSVSCWVMIIDKNSKYPRLFDFANDVSNNNRIVLTIDGQYGFFFWFSNNGAFVNIVSATTQLNLNQWTFMTVTYSNQVLKYYFNETYVGGGATGISWPGTKTNLNYFGKDIWGDSNGLSTMQIFDFKIYNKVISDEERLIDFYNGTYNVQEMFTN